MGDVYKKKLDGWQLIYLYTSLCANTLSIALMEQISMLDYRHNEIYIITGIAAILLMLVHTLWATYIFTLGTTNARKHYKKYNISVWSIWIILYGISIYTGISLK